MVKLLYHPIYNIYIWNISRFGVGLLWFNLSAAQYHALWEVEMPLLLCSIAQQQLKHQFVISIVSLPKTKHSIIPDTEENQFCPSCNQDKDHIKSLQYLTGSAQVFPWGQKYRHGWAATSCAVSEHIFHHNKASECNAVSVRNAMMPMLEYSLWLLKNTKCYCKGKIFLMM